MSVGIPIKILHEAEGQIITVETTTGEIYRGKLTQAEDNMNCQMTALTVTYKDGRVAQLENVYIRGSKIKFLILPDKLQNSAVFKRVSKSSGRGKPMLFSRHDKGGPSCSSGSKTGNGGSSHSGSARKSVR